MAMGFSARLCVMLAFAAFTPAFTAMAQEAQLRVSRPAVAALARPTLPPEEAFARLPQARQAQLSALADQEPLANGALSPASSDALAGMTSADGDIASLTMIVMMLVARDAEADLREIMTQMNARREASRDGCPPQNEDASNDTRVVLTRPVARAIQDAVSGANARATAPTVAASPSGQTARPASPPQPAPPCPDEMAALRLQMYMDRRTRAQEMLSNMLRRQSETSESITQNLK